MQKVKSYRQTRFPAHVLENAYKALLSCVDPKRDAKPWRDLRVTIGAETWYFDSVEEFLAEYPKAIKYRFDHIIQERRLFVNGNDSDAEVLVALPTRSEIEQVFQVFERSLAQSHVEPTCKIFVGHGHDPQWRDLRDHLQDKHALKVVAYEVGPRAGLSVKEVLQTMLDQSSFALLVLTGEDLHQDGELHARENVIHELGLFQGRLGFKKAIVLLEEEVREFSNILGVNQIRFSKGRIREAFGDVVATIRREFSERE